MQVVEGAVHGSIIEMMVEPVVELNQEEVNILPSSTEDVKAAAGYVNISRRFSCLAKQDTIEVHHAEVHLDVADTVHKEGLDVITLPETSTATVEKEIRETERHDVADVNRSILTTQETMKASQDEMRLRIGETISEKTRDVNEMSDTAYMKDEKMLECEPEQAATGAEYVNISRRFSCLAKQDTMEVHHAQVNLDVANTIDEESIVVETLPETPTATVEREIQETETHDIADVHRSVLTMQETMKASQDEMRLRIGETILEETPEIDEMSDAAYVKDEEMDYEPEQAAPGEEYVNISRRFSCLAKQDTMEVHHAQVNLDVADTIDEESLDVETLPETPTATVEREIQEMETHNVADVNCSVMTTQDTMKASQDEMRLTIGETILEETPEIDEMSDAAYVKDEEMDYEPCLLYTSPSPRD